MRNAKDRGAYPDPKKLKPTARQAQRLAALTGVDASQLSKLTFADVTEKFGHIVDPDLLFFQRVTGRVIKRDGEGNEYPVPGATVHVEDTDGSFLAYSPDGWPYSWLLPLASRREEIATAVTDECGNFSAFVPRFDIDYVISWRSERFCYGDVFLRPSIRDVLEGLHPIPKPKLPIPEPDPAPFLRVEGGMRLARAEEVLGREQAARYARAEMALQFGARVDDVEQLLEESAFPRGLTPPLPEDLQRMEAKRVLAMAPAGMRDAREAALPAEVTARHWLGPFMRCTTIPLPRVTPILDAPDITFRVTQDVDGDGDEEQVYGESFFDVRWNATSLPEVTLVASDIALHGVGCHVPDVACAKPGIATIGLMPVANPAAPALPFLDAAEGYAQRPNRPHADGLVASSPSPLARAESPFTGTLQLYGCSHKQGAKHYRVLHGTTTGDMVPFFESWKVYRLTSSPPYLEQRTVTPDANGWYEILPEDEHWFPSHLLMNWRTTASANGRHFVSLQLGNASRNPVETTTPIAVHVDNSAPTTYFTSLAWRPVGAADWTEMPHLTCPVIQRPKNQEIELKVGWTASAAHLRSCVLTAGGCGGGDPVLHPSGNPAPAEHWHRTPSEDAVGKVAVYRLPASAPAGAYRFHLSAASRAFNPAGGDGGFESDWLYDPVYRHATATLPISVVDAAPGIAVPAAHH